MNSFAVEVKYQECMKQLAEQLYNNLIKEPNNVHELTENFQRSCEKLLFARDWANQLANETLRFDDDLPLPTLE